MQEVRSKWHLQLTFQLRSYSVKVWSPVAGKKLLLKFEGAGAAFEKNQLVLRQLMWQELSFDFTG
jgi:hypothetical protein